MTTDTEDQTAPEAVFSLADDSELHREKILNERLFTILGDAQLRAVVEKFGTEPFRRSSVTESFDAVVRALNFRGRRCVEIGSWMGLTAIVLARYFEEVISIDIFPTSEKHEIAAFLGVKNIRFLDVRNNIEKAKLIETLKFDAAYCDGDHAKDTFSDFALVQRCGHVLMHEVWAAQPPVMKLVRRLSDSGGVVTTKGKFGVWRA